MTDKYKAKKIDVDAGEHTIILNRQDAHKLGSRSLDRVRVSSAECTITAIMELTDSVVEPGTVGLLTRAFQDLCVTDDEMVGIVRSERPESIEFIKKKMDGLELSQDEIRRLVIDIVERNLTDIELSAYVVANYVNPMNQREIKDLIVAMVDTGETIEIDKKPVFDFHSIGGVPGNKVTLVVVPILAAYGMCVPKTSSRAISSACGTADILETLCEVTLTAKEIKDITEEVGGIIAWGGGVNIAPADDLIIRAEYPLAIDPYSQVIASVMAKKKAVGAEYFLLDIPIGPTTKVENMELGRKYARDFIELGEMLGIKVECAITYGNQPIGRAVGPAVEAQEALMVLEGKDTSSAVVEKSLSLAGILMEMNGLPRGEGKRQARKILESGQALTKFKEILKAQHGDPNVTSETVKLGAFKTEVKSIADGYVAEIDNKKIVKVVRAAGAPFDKGAGIILNKKKGHKVEVDEPLFTLYADNEAKLARAKAQAQKESPFAIEGMVLDRVPSYSTQGF